MGVAKSMMLRGGGGGGPTLSVTMTLIFPKIVWTCPLTGADIGGLDLVRSSPPFVSLLRCNI